MESSELSILSMEQAFVLDDFDYLRSILKIKYFLHLTKMFQEKMGNQGGACAGKRGSDFLLDSQEGGRFAFSLMDFLGKA